MSIQNFPALFIGHGSPMNATGSNSYTGDLARYSSLIARPDAIVVISAHWLTRGTFITAAKRPEQIYDFYGFPDELYSVRYAPPGSPETAELISKTCSFVKPDQARGIDHAAWAVVKHIFPGADVPLLEISLDMELSPREHFNAGRELGMLRPHNILFIGSGNLGHNLSVIDFNDDAGPYDWAVAIDESIKKKIETRDVESLIDYKKNLDNHRLAIPTSEHYLPMLYIMGMLLESESPRFIHESIQNGSISMRSFEIR